MKVNMTKKSKIAIGLVIALLMVTTVAAITAISTTWISPYITVSPLLLSLSSDLTADTTVQPEVAFGYTMILENPNTAYSYTGVHVMVEIRDVSGDHLIFPADVTVEYYDEFPSPSYPTPSYTWKTITFTPGADYAFIFHDWAAYGFTMPPGAVTMHFRATYHTLGIYQAQAYALQ